MRVVALSLLGAFVCTSLGALQRDLKTKIKNYPKAPVAIKSSKVSLIETFTAPTQFAAPGAPVRTTRVQYANRAGLSPSVWVLTGEVLCVNQSPQAIEAVQLTIVMLDAFHQALQVFTPGAPNGVK